MGFFEIPLSPAALSIPKRPSWRSGVQLQLRVPRPEQSHFSLACINTRLF